MTIQLDKKDVVIVGLGWTGSILAIELAREGLDIVALERGPMQRTVPDFAYPKVVDELKYAIRHKAMQHPAIQTQTIRHNINQTALPYRRLGSYLPGNGVGGAGVHWNGHTWRPQAQELRLRSYIEETFGADIIPEDMTIQDWGVTYEELEPHLDRFEYVAGISGTGGNIKGSIQSGGNPFESPRSRDFPLPPLSMTMDARLFKQATSALGFSPFPRPAANASKSYTNEYGMQLGPCNYCGFCERFGCLNYSKASPQTCVLDALYQKENFEVRTNAEVLKVELAADGKTATGVTYIDEDQNETFQPADLVLLCAYQLNNVHLLLNSGIGSVYDPQTGEGVVGRNYSYQVTGGTSLMFNDKVFNPFVGTGSQGYSILDFGMEQIDYAQEGFIGGSVISTGQTNGQPIRNMPVPPKTPSWGAGWKEAIGQYYGHFMSIGSHGSNMSYRDCYLDLDPTYKDRFGRPLLRMTFDWKDNDIKMTQFMKTKTEAIAEQIAPDFYGSRYKQQGSHYNVAAYQSTHNVGGAIMGTDPSTSALNRYLQSWDVHNVWVAGANCFPQNLQFNPTGIVGGLTYWMVDALRNHYLKQPRPLG